MLVYNDAAGEYHHAIFFWNGNREFLPMQQVLADGVPPAHVAPRDTKWIVLVEQMVLAFVVDEPIGVVHPVHGRREVILRPITLDVRRRVLSPDRPDVGGRQQRDGESAEHVDVRHQRETEWCLRALVPVGTCARGRKSLNVVAEKDGNSCDFASDAAIYWRSRTHIYQDRETQERRAEAANVRRRLRLGPSAQASSSEPNEPNGRPPVDLDAMLALLSDEQRAALAARLNAPESGSAAPPRAAPKRKRRGAQIPQRV